MWLLFGAGLLTGFHCLSMCGNLVIGYSMRSNKSINWKNHLIYNFFRLMSYSFTGFLLGFLGKGLNLAAYGGTASIVAGIFMLLLGLKLLGVIKPGVISVFPGLTFLKNKLFKLTEKARKLSQISKVHYLPEAAFGSLSGFMPCAPLQAAQLYAAGTGSPLLGALAMLIFGLGTVPLLFSYGTLTGKLSFAFKNRLATVSALLIIFLGLLVLNRGLTLSGSPFNFARLKGLVLASFNQEGRQAEAVKIKIENSRYFPSTIKLAENKPLKIIVFRNEDSACSNEIVFPQIGLRKALRPFEETLVEMPPLKAGTYEFTCQMGMMSGTLIVGEGSKTASIYFGVLLLSLGALGLWYSLNESSLKRESKVSPGKSKIKRKEKQ